MCYYHADIPAAEKETRQRLWSKGDIKVICATIAFGMGINKPDVRYVIHHSLPKSLTNYYQESGRAGRDGAPSECVLYFSARDRGKLTTMITKSAEEVGSDKAPSAFSFGFSSAFSYLSLRCVACYAFLF